MSPESDEVTLVWNSLEGGTYLVASSGDLGTWKTLTATQVASSAASETSLRIAAAVPRPGKEFFRVTRTALTAYDSTGGGNTGGGGGGGGTTQPLTAVSPAAGDRGTTVTVTFTLGGTPPPGPVNPTSATLGTISGTQILRSGNSVSARFVLPANAAIGPVTAAVVFPGPPGTGNVTFNLANGFMIR